VNVKKSELRAAIAAKAAKIQATIAKAKEIGRKIAALDRKREGLVNVFAKQIAEVTRLIADMQISVAAAAEA
jgi:hypothetical protein